MIKSVVSVLTFAVILTAGILIGLYFRGDLALSSAAAASQESMGGSSPVKSLSEQDVYYPGSEDIAPDEMRVVACGTGMPNARPKQAAACFLVELGNGDKFIFDIGSGSAERLSAMKIPYDYLDKVFIGHLHSDHFGALADLWIGGVIGNLIKPLRVWGPSGHKPEFGTAYALDHMEKVFTWDSGSRQGNVPEQMVAGAYEGGGRRHPRVLRLAKKSYRKAEMDGRCRTE
jgi:ribonuclease Z